MRLLDFNGKYSAFLKQMLITCLIYSVFIMVGLCRGYTSFLIIQLKADDSRMHLTTDEESWLATLGILPNPFGCILAGPAMDVFGRKLCVSIMFPLFLIGWLIIGVSTNVYTVYAGVFINGFAAGTTMCNALYVAEITASEYRGFMLPFLPVFFCLGVLLCNVSLYYVGWKTSAYVFAACCALLFVPTLFLPESPCWLVDRGREEKASDVLIALRNDRSEAERELNVLIGRRRERLEKKTIERRHLSDVVGHVYSCRRQLTLVAVLYLLQHSVGYIVFISYNASIMQQLDIPIDVDLASLIYMCVLFVSTLFGPLVQHYTPRRRSMMIGGLCSALCFGSASFYLTLCYRYERLEKPYYWFLLISIYAAVTFCDLFIIAITYSVPGEVFPNEDRGLLMGISGTICYVIATVIVKIFLWCMYTFGIIAVFWLFTFSYGTAVVIGYFMPETKGKSLDRIQEEYFAGRKKFPPNEQGGSTAL